MQDRKAYLYKFTWPGGQWYIGVTVNPSHRRHKHFDDLRKGVHNNRRMQRTFNKYGEPSFSLILCGPEEYVYDMEVMYIERTGSDPNKINQIPGGRGGSAKPQTEAFERMREGGRKGAFALTPEQRKENGRKISEKLKGRPSPYKGKTYPSHPCPNCSKPIANRRGHINCERAYIEKQREVTRSERMLLASEKRSQGESLILSGMYYTEIAYLLDCSEHTVLRWASELGVKRKRGRKPSSQRELLSSLYSPDKTYEELASELNINSVTVRKWLEEDYGIKLSRGRPRKNSRQILTASDSR